jgi:hypothetical protein
MRSAREDFIAEELEYAAEHPEEFVGREALIERHGGKEWRHSEMLVGITRMKKAKQA